MPIVPQLRRDSESERSAYRIRQCSCVAYFGPNIRLLRPAGMRPFQMWATSATFLLDDDGQHTVYGGTRLKPLRKEMRCVIAGSCISFAITAPEQLRPNPIFRGASSPFGLDVAVAAGTLARKHQQSAASGWLLAALKLQLSPRTEVPRIPNGLSDPLTDLVRLGLRPNSRTR